MRFAILSDIHGNFQALKAVLNDLEKKEYDDVIFLGDVVGYGAEPNECVEKIFSLASYLLLGNHDAAVLDKREIFNFNINAREAILWTMEVLSQDNIERIKKMELRKKIGDQILAVHSSPLKPRSWTYILSLSEAYIQFGHFEEKICLFGHTHIPVVLELKKKNRIEEHYERKIKLAHDSKYLINPGSVGQPRDLDPRASYGILDLEESTFELFRVEYNVEETKRRIMEARLPFFLAERLQKGV